MFAVGRHFVAICLTWAMTAMISLPGFSSASNTPGIPTDLQVTTVRDLTIMLTWKRPLTTAGTPDNSTLSYIVSFSAGGISANRQIVTTESAQLNLLVNKQYNIFVKAIQRDDHQMQGDWSGGFKVDTNDLVPAKPANLNVTNVNGLTITVSWDKPRTTAVKGIKDTSTLNYYVGYKNLESNTRRQITSSTERADLRGLSANSRYEIQVKAYKTFNTQLAGPWSEFLTLKTNESVPSKSPSSVKVVSSTPSSIKVSWGPIPKDGRNGIILGFVVFYRQQGSSKWSERDVTPVYSLDLTRLTTGKMYFVKVAGYTKIGRGTKSGLKSIIVGGQFITTTRKITTQKPTTLVADKTHSSSVITSRTVSGDTTEGTVKTTDVFSKEPNRTTSSYSASESAAKPSVSSSVHPPPVHNSDQSTPAIAAIGRADEESKENFLNKIMMIGAPAAGALLVIIILIIVFVSSIRRSRRRKQLQQNGEIPLKIVKSSRRRRSKDVVTRGACSVRYAPPSEQSTLTRDSMTEGLLQTGDEPDQPVIVVQPPNGSLPRTEAEDAPLLATGYSEKCDHLRVDLSSKETTEESASRLYDSIGSLLKAGCSNEAKHDKGKSDDEERYVTQEQIDSTRDNAQAQIAPHEDHYKRPKEGVVKDVPHGNTYENLLDADHLYESLGLKDPEDPVYENTRAFSSSDHENIDRGREYEPSSI